MGWGVRQGRRVLLAEDNLINQTVAKKMLGQMGMQCTVASNGAEAVDALRAAAATGQQFEVVLMDMAMPVMGGVDATKVRAGCQGTQEDFAKKGDWVYSGAI